MDDLTNPSTNQDIYDYSYKKERAEFIILLLHKLNSSITLRFQIERLLHHMVVVKMESSILYDPIGSFLQ